MKKQKYLLLALPILALVLECLPTGAVLHFANPEGAALRQTYNYFDLTPYGYANFGPLLTAILTVVLLALALAYVIKPNRGLSGTLMGVSAVAFVASLMPLLLGLRYYTSVAACISAILLLAVACAFVIHFGKEKNV